MQLLNEHVFKVQYYAGPCKVEEGDAGKEDEDANGARAIAPIMVKAKEKGNA